MTEPANPRRKRDLLYRLAASQKGYFTTRQAADAGISSPLLRNYVRTGFVVRISPRVHRLARFPIPDDDEQNADLVALWVATECEGVFSHETALALHRLSDVLPARVHLILPPSWKRRALPGDPERHYDVLDPSEVSWAGSIPVTSPLRTLMDCIAVSVSPELVTQAIMHAQKRGLIATAQAAELMTHYGDSNLRYTKPIQGRPRGSPA